MNAKRARLLGRKPKGVARPLWWAMRNSYGIALSACRVDGAKHDGKDYFYPHPVTGQMLQLPGDEVSSRPPEAVFQ